jgi:hypothetical protein
MDYAENETSEFGKRKFQISPTSTKSPHTTFLSIIFFQFYFQLLFQKTFNLEGKTFKQVLRTVIQLSFALSSL